MAIKNSWASGEVLTAADLTDTMKGVSINPQTGTSYTFALTDGFVTLSNASGGTATIPTNTTAAFNTGAVIGVMNAGTAGSFVIAPAATVTLNAVSGTTTLAPLESATIVKLGTNTWQLSKGGGLPKATYSATTGSPTVTTVSGKTCVEFTGSGSITISQAGTVEVLMVAGGGGGGMSRGGGGGGAGGHFYMTSAFLPVGTLTVTVGAGGGGGRSIEVNNLAGQSGGVSRLGNYFVPGGGSGMGYSSYIGLGNGASGGGGSSSSGTGGAGISDLGNNGGTGGGTFQSATESGGGGGGAGAVGGNASSTTVAGNGGNGTANSITGSSVTRAGGGGGGASGTAGTGGTGGGGAGATSGNATNGTANTGGGGGGTHANNANGGNGGSGIVILLFG